MLKLLKPLFSELETVSAALQKTAFKLDQAEKKGEGLEGEPECTQEAKVYPILQQNISRGA